MTSVAERPWTASVSFLEYRPLGKLLPPPDQTIADRGAVTPAAANNLAAANAAVTTGASNLQSTTERALL